MVRSPQPHTDIYLTNEDTKRLSPSQGAMLLTKQTSGCNVVDDVASITHLGLPRESTVLAGRWMSPPILRAVHSFHLLAQLECLRLVYQCTRTHLPHSPSWAEWVDTAFVETHFLCHSRKREEREEGEDRKERVRERREVRA